jgi:hypothetical protein
VVKPGYSPQVDRWELLAPSSDNVRPYLDVASMELWADDLNDVGQIQAIHTGMASASRSGRARWVNGVRTGHSVFQLFAHQIHNSQLSRYSTLCHDHVRKALPVSLIGHLLAFCLTISRQSSFAITKYCAFCQSCGMSFSIKQSELGAVLLSLLIKRLSRFAS